MGKSVLAKLIAGHVAFDFGYDFIHYESPPGFLFAIMYFFIIRVLITFSTHRNFCRSILIKLFSFSTIVKTVLQTDFFRNKFQRTNNLFGPPSCRLRYFSKDKRKTLWEHKYYYCYRGGVVLPSRGGQMPGWGGRENEIALCEIFHKP